MKKGNDCLIRIRWKYLYPVENELFTVDAVDKRRDFDLSSVHKFDVCIGWSFIFDWRRLEAIESVPLSSSVVAELTREIFRWVSEIL